MSEIEDIKNRLSIDEVIGSYIKLEKAGSNFKAACPFHNEKTPSFYVTPDKGFYKCFGCGESGDIFNFVEKYEGIDFKEALKKLADKAGVELKQQNRNLQEDLEKKKEKERLLKILYDITIFWQKNLLNNEDVKNYLKKRGVNNEMAKKFQLGYAEAGWDNTFNFLKSKGYSEYEIEKVGLIKKKEQGGYYDRFRNRIIFPIFNLDGKPVAFSGRDFSGEENVAKYLNSPETIFFNKSAILYGMNFARDEARRRKYFILAEGQMDLVMSHKVGFTNTVITSGTSLTDEHLKIMGRYSKNIIFAFDSDNAGVNAAYKGIKKAIASDFDVKIISMEKGKDPADTILESEEKWKDLIVNAKNFIDFFIEKIIFQKKSDREKIQEMEEKILPFIVGTPDPILKGKFIAKIARGFDVKDEFIIEALKNTKIEIEEKERRDGEMLKIQSENIDIFSKKGIISNTRKKILRELSAIYFWQESLSESKRWVDPNNLLEKIKKITDEEVFEKILGLDEKIKNLLILEVQVKFEEETKENLEFSIKSYENRFEKNNIDNEMSELTKKISFANDLERKNILKKIQKLTEKKNNY